MKGMLIKIYAPYQREREMLVTALANLGYMVRVASYASKIDVTDKDVYVIVRVNKMHVIPEEEAK
jgi:hypothetical protein